MALTLSAVTHVPAEVLLSMTPELLEAEDMKVVGGVCKAWAGVAEWLERERLIQEWLRTWPQLAGPEEEAEVRALSTEGVRRLVEVYKYVRLVEPVADWWCMPIAFCKHEFSAELRVAQLQALQLVGEVSESFEECDNPTVFYSLFMVDLVKELAMMIQDPTRRPYHLFNAILGSEFLKWNAWEVDKKRWGETFSWVNAVHKVVSEWAPRCREMHIAQLTMAMLKLQLASVFLAADKRQNWMRRNAIMRIVVNYDFVNMFHYVRLVRANMMWDETREDNGDADLVEDVYGLAADVSYVWYLLMKVITFEEMAYLKAGGCAFGEEWKMLPEGWF